MTLGQLLSDDCILPELASRDRWGVIEELAECLFAGGHLAAGDRECIFSRLHDRENRLSTGVGSGVAIPHALCPHVDHVVAAFGRSRAGIEFDAMDQEPVHIVVLFVVPDRQYRLRLETLSAIGKTLANPELRERLMHATTAAELKLVLGGRPDSRVHQRNGKA